MVTPRIGGKPIPPEKAFRAKPGSAEDYRQKWLEAIDTVITLASQVEQLKQALEEFRYAELEHEHLGCSVAKTGIYAPKE